MILRDYQKSALDQIVSSNTDDVLQLDTGGGKTAIINALAQMRPTVSIAHRNMLIEQISATHSKSGVSHRIIGNSHTTKRCQLTQRRHGVSYGGDVWVGSVQSIISHYKRGKLAVDPLTIEQVIIDECHHVAKDNMWAKMGEVFPNARFIGVTATPCRLDGQGLGKEFGGLFDRLVQAEQLRENSKRWLISNGYLCDFEYWCPPTRVNYSLLKQNGGDYTIDSIDDAVNTDLVFADVIKEYKRLADNKTALLYCTRIDRANQLTRMFKDAGYSATYIASTLGQAKNSERLDAFRRGEVKILINVEMATEGFDLPDAQCIIMLRPTASIVLFLQMIGRGLRPKKDGSKAIIIDHVSNVWKHGLPDDRIMWTLNGTPENCSEKMGACSCGFVYNVHLKACPLCGQKNQILARAQHVNDLLELSIIDEELVQQVRSRFAQQQIEDARKAKEREREALLKVEIQQPDWHSYGKGHAVDSLCIKMRDWFIVQLRDSDLTIEQINQFTTGTRPPIEFWMNNFTVKDIGTRNPAKCKKVMQKWLSK